MWEGAPRPLMREVDCGGGAGGLRGKEGEREKMQEGT